MQEEVLVRKGFCLSIDLFLSNTMRHRKESDLDSMWFKIMLNERISRYDTCIAVQKYY